MTDIVDRLRKRDQYDRIVVLDHLNRPYGLAKSLEHEAADEIERLREALRIAIAAMEMEGLRTMDLRAALGDARND